MAIKLTKYPVNHPMRRKCPVVNARHCICGVKMVKMLKIVSRQANASITCVVRAKILRLFFLSYLFTISGFIHFITKNVLFSILYYCICKASRYIIPYILFWKGRKEMYCGELLSYRNIQNVISIIVFIKISSNSIL